MIRGLNLGAWREDTVFFMLESGKQGRRLASPIPVSGCAILAKLGLTSPVVRQRTDSQLCKM